MATTTNNYLTSSLAQTENVFVSKDKALKSNNNTTTNTSIGNTATLKDILPSAASVYKSQSMTLPKSVGYFI